MHTQLSVITINYLLLCPVFGALSQILYIYIFIYDIRIYCTNISNARHVYTGKYNKPTYRPFPPAQKKNTINYNNE